MANNNQNNGGCGTLCNKEKEEQKEDRKRLIGSNIGQFEH